jgi:predicted nucleotidyltransferase
MEHMRISILDLAKKFGCILIYLFGSQAEDGKRYLEGEEIRPDTFSDLDVAVAFRNLSTIPINIYGELYRDISEILVPFNIDLIIIHEMDPLFQYEIIKGIRVYEEDERITEEFEEKVMKKAGDLIIKKRVLDHEIMEAIENGYFEFEYRADP